MATHPQDAKQQNHPVLESGQTTWPIFICYRQDDGKEIAQWLYDSLHQQQLSIPGLERKITLDVYFDQTAAAVDDWTRIHRPALERSRALLFICTPGARASFGPGDWVHRELQWWLDNRDTTPIIIDPHDSDRWIPDPIKIRWPQQQRVVVQPREWDKLPQDERDPLEQNARERLLRGLIESERATTYEDLERERKRTRLLQKQGRRLKALLAANLVFMIVTAGFLWQRARDAEKTLMIREAESIMAATATKETKQLSESESDALWRLAGTENEMVRHKVLTLALSSRSNAHSFHLRAELLANAAIGLDAKRQSAVARDIVNPALRQLSTQPEIATASAHMARLVLGAPAGKEQAAGVLELLLSAIVNTTSGTAVDELVAAIGAVLDRAPALEETKLLAYALPRLQSELPMAQTEAAIGLLKIAAGRLAADEAPAGFRAVVEAWSTAPERHRPSYLNAMRLLADRVHSDVRREVAMEVLGVTLGGPESITLILDQQVLKPGDLRGDERPVGFESLLALIESGKGTLTQQVRAALSLIPANSAPTNGPMLESLTESVTRRLGGKDSVSVDHHVSTISSLANDGADLDQAAVNWLYDLISNELDRGKSYYQATARLAVILAGLPGTMPESASRRAFDAILHVLHGAQRGEDGDVPTPDHFQQLGKGLAKAIHGLPAGELPQASKQLLTSMRKPPSDDRHSDSQLVAFGRGLVALAYRSVGRDDIELPEASLDASGDSSTVEIISNLTTLASGRSDAELLIENTGKGFAGRRADDDLLVLYMEILARTKAKAPEAFMTQIHLDLLIGRHSRASRRHSRNLWRAAIIAGPGVSSTTAATVYLEAVEDLTDLIMENVKETEELLNLLADRLAPEQVGPVALDLAEKIAKAEDATLNGYTFKIWREASQPLIRPLVRHLDATAALKTANRLLENRRGAIGATSAATLKLLGTQLSPEGRAEIALALLGSRYNLRPATELVVDLPPTPAGTAINKRLIAILADSRTPKSEWPAIARLATELAPSLAEPDRKELSMAIAERMPALNDPEILQSFASVLATASIELTAEQRHQISARIVDLLKEPSTSPLHLPSLSEALAAVPGGTPPVLLEEAFDSLRHRMLDLRDLANQQPLGQALLALPGTLSVADLIETLKWPTTTGVLRESVIERIEQQERADFHGSLFSLIEWSNERGFNVRANPRRQVARAGQN